ncbi:MAG: NAD(P)-dependent oxidoreductase [Eggerthellaceae bacterium]|nr:NAD(P)-dependent oxidoreductase [Eggerthellaceae bacterium]
MAKITSYDFDGDGTLGKVVASAMARAGVRRARDVKAAKVVFTYFDDEGDLEDAYFDSEGLVQLANPGTFLVDLSPASPRFAQELFAVASVSDLHFVAAPLAVADPAAEAPFAPENLTILAGGETADVQEVAGLLAALGTVHRVGSAEEAQLAKAAYTIAQTSRLVAAIETDALFRAVSASTLHAAPDVERARELLPADDVRESVLRAVLAKQFSSGYTVEMLYGEIAAALTAADDVELILPQLEAAMSLVELLEVIEERPLAPAALSLLFADQEEGRRHGLDWARSKEFFAEGGVTDTGWDDEDDEDDGHVHGHAHTHLHGDDCDCGHDHTHVHASVRPRAASADALYDDEDQPYGFDRFDIGHLGDDDGED